MLSLFSNTKLKNNAAELKEEKQPDTRKSVQTIAVIISESKYSYERLGTFNQFLVSKENSKILIEIHLNKFELLKLAIVLYSKVENFNALDDGLTFPPARLIFEAITDLVSKNRSLRELEYYLNDQNRAASLITAIAHLQESYKRILITTGNIWELLIHIKYIKEIKQFIKMICNDQLEDYKKCSSQVNFDKIIKNAEKLSAMCPILLHINTLIESACDIDDIFNYLTRFSVETHNNIASSFVILCQADVGKWKDNLTFLYNHWERSAEIATYLKLKQTENLNLHPNVLKHIENEIDAYQKIRLCLTEHVIDIVDLETNQDMKVTAQKNQRHA